MTDRDKVAQNSLWSMVGGNTKHNIYRGGSLSSDFRCDKAAEDDSTLILDNGRNVSTQATTYHYGKMLERIRYVTSHNKIPPTPSGQ